MMVSARPWPCPTADPHSLWHFLNIPLPGTVWDKGALSALGTKGCPSVTYWSGDHKSSGPVSSGDPGTGETGVHVHPALVCVGLGVTIREHQTRATSEQQRPGSCCVRSAPAGIHMVCVSLQLCLSSCHGRAHKQPIPVSLLH